MWNWTKFCFSFDKIMNEDIIFVREEKKKWNCDCYDNFVLQILEQNNSKTKYIIREIIVDYGYRMNSVKKKD